MVVAGVLKNESREQGSGGWPRSNDAGFEIETCGPNRRRLVYLDEFQLVSFLPLESIASDHVGRPEGDAKTFYSTDDSGPGGHNENVGTVVRYRESGCCLHPSRSGSRGSWRLSDRTGGRARQGDRLVGALGSARSFERRRKLD